MTRPSVRVLSAASNWLAFAATLAVTFLLTPYLIRSLGTARYDVWAVMEGVLAYLTLLDLGIAACLVRQVARSHATGDQAAVNRLVGLGDDYVTRNLAELREVTPESATQAYRSLVDVDALTLVVVGDADVIADPLRELGFTDLEVVRPEG